MMYLLAKGWQAPDIPETGTPVFTLEKIEMEIIFTKCVKLTHVFTIQ
jgi:hypothetical protein